MPRFRHTEKLCVQEPRGRVPRTALPAPDTPLLPNGPRFLELSLLGAAVKPAAWE